MLWKVCCVWCAVCDDVFDFEILQERSTDGRLKRNFLWGHILYTIEISLACFLLVPGCLLVVLERRGGRS